MKKCTTLVLAVVAALAFTAAPALAGPYHPGRHHPGPRHGRAIGFTRVYTQTWPRQVYYPPVYQPQIYVPVAPQPRIVHPHHGPASRVLYGPGAIYRGGIGVDTGGIGIRIRF